MISGPLYLDHLQFEASAHVPKQGAADAVSK